MAPAASTIASFLRAASVWPGHDRREQAAAMLAADPAIGAANIYTAATVGDDRSVRRFLVEDRRAATATGGPAGWDALTHLCFSEFLRSDRARARSFLRCATLLLDAGADPKSGWWDTTHRPAPEFESVIYAASALARDPALTRLLLSRGADPNDAETPYHAPETYDNRTVRVLVNSGLMTADSLSTMILRKADWHDLRGMAWLLDHGADPNHFGHWHHTALHQALRRDNALAQIRLLVRHGADPAMPNRLDGASAVQLAARRGRGDVLKYFARRRVPMSLDGPDRLLAACAVGDRRAFLERASALRGGSRGLANRGADALAAFSGVNNAAGVRLLLDFGVDVDVRYGGDGYWDLAPRSTALHVAAWRASHDVVSLLVARGADVNARDGRGRTALMLAIKACVDSYWISRRSPRSVKALLRAGASRKGVTIPSGYRAVDRLFSTRPRV